MFEPHFKEKLPKISTTNVFVTHIPGVWPVQPAHDDPIERPSGRRSLESVFSTRSVLARWIVAQRFGALNFCWGPAPKKRLPKIYIIWSFWWSEVMIFQYDFPEKNQHGWFFWVNRFSKNFIWLIFFGEACFQGCRVILIKVKIIYDKINLCHQFTSRGFVKHVWSTA